MDAPRQLSWQSYEPRQDADQKPLTTSMRGDGGVVAAAWPPISHLLPPVVPSTGSIECRPRGTKSPREWSVVAVALEKNQVQSHLLRP